MDKQLPQHMLWRMYESETRAKLREITGTSVKSNLDVTTYCCRPEATAA